MKRTLLSLSLLVLASCASSLKETPAVLSESRLVLADPFICRDGDSYYAFGTNAPDGFYAYESQDLQTWHRCKGGAADGYALHKSDVSGNKMFWAPEVYKVGERFYMLYTSEERPRIAVADRVTGPYKEYESEAMTDDPNGIDNTLFVDDDGTCYMYWVRFGLGKGNEIRVSRLTGDLSRVEGEQVRCICAEEPWETVFGRVTEAPTVFKHKGLYYMTYSANDYRSQDYAVGFAVADSPLGPWRKYEGNPILRRPCNLVGTGHSSIFYDRKGRMMMVFHAHRSADRVQPRMTYFTDLKFKRGTEYDILTIGGHYIVPAKWQRP